MAGKTNELVAWCKEAGSQFDNAEYDAIVASGELVTAGLLALVLKDMGLKSRSWQGWQIPILTDDAHGAARIAKIDGAAARRRLWGGRGRGGRGLPGPAWRDEPGDDARARRLGHLGGGARRGDPRRPLRHLHRRRRRLHDRPAHRGEGAQARQDLVRGNARNGVARRQGAAGALGRGGHGAQGQALRAVVLRRSGRPEAWHAHLRRGGYRGAAGRHRHRLLARRGADHAARRGRQARRRGGDLRAAGRGQHQRRHDHPGRVGGRGDDRHHLHRIRAPTSSAPRRSSRRGARRSATRG